MIRVAGSSVGTLGILAWIALAGANGAAAQDVLGGIGGRVLDSTGVPVASARVALAGTVFSAVTDARGHYAIDDVPAGDYTVRVDSGGAAAAAWPAIHVPAGAAIVLNLRLRSAPSATPEPALALTSRTLLTGEELRRLPVDDPEQALPLAPGVGLRSGDIGVDSRAEFSVRGSPLAATAFYVDGAPARFETMGNHALALGFGGVSEADVTTGIPSLLATGAAGGLVNYITRNGGPQLAGQFRAESDEPFGDGSSVGYNRFEGAVGGPVPSVPNLTWFLAGTMQGQRSQYRGLGAADQPTYVPAGLDTVVAITDLVGTVTRVPIPRFAQASGTCGGTGSSGSPIAAAIQSNYGYACTGLRQPFDWSTVFRGQAKLLYSWGAGSSLSVTALLSGFQQRVYPGQDIGAPGLYQGGHTWSRLVVANWTQRLPRLGTGRLTFAANVSVGTDRQVTGPLAPISELVTRDPALGIESQTLQFSGTEALPFPVTDDIIRSLRTNNGLPQPYPTNLRPAQPYRLNPFGVLRGWPTQGLGGPITLVSERRVNGRASFAWQPGDAHRITVGVEAEHIAASLYESSLTAGIFQNAFVTTPSGWGLFAGDRVTLGSAVIDFGARYDQFSAGGLFPKTPSSIFSNPASAPYLPAAATDPAVYAAFLADPNIWTPARTHHAVSPHLSVGYALSQRTSVRFAYGQQVNPVPLGRLFSGVNTDFTVANVITGLFGRDVDYVKSTLFEGGARYRFAADGTFDITVYHKDRLAPYAARIQPFPDPGIPGTVLNVNVLTTVDGGSGSGWDTRLGWARGRILGASLEYALVPPSDQFAAATHVLYGEVTAHVPTDWKAGTALGAVARDLGALVTFRATSGLAYTRLVNSGTGITAPTGDSSILANSIEAAGASRLPWTQTLDLRFSKGLRTGGRDWSVYVDFRNVFNFRNTRGLYAETGDVVNPNFLGHFLSPEFNNLKNEASSNGALRSPVTVVIGGNTIGTGSVDVSSCATWSNPVNCVMLQRTEARFGDGTHPLLFTPDDQLRAFTTYFDAFFGAWRFYGPGRTLRLGVEARF